MKAFRLFSIRAAGTKELMQKMEQVLQDAQVSRPDDSKRIYQDAKRTGQKTK